MDDLVGERLGNHEHTTIDNRAGGGGGQARDVTGGAANGSEQQFTLQGVGGGRQLGIAGRSFCAADEGREVIDVCEPETIWLVLRVRGDFTYGGGVSRSQSTRDSHFVQ